jgi:two-component sensor histidine kinase
LDRKGRLWLASAGSGLIRVDDPDAERPVFRAYTTAEGLSSNTAEGVTEDLYGHIYVGTGRGLDRLDPVTGQFKHFTTADGLAPGRVIAGFRDRTGALWFGTAKGLSRFLPRADEATAPPPSVLITQISVAGEERNVSAIGETEISLNHMAADQSQLQIGFVGLSFTPGEVLRYQFMLEGADRDWSTPTEQRSITYPRVAPGSYRLLVRALNSDGVVSPQPAIVSFTILPPIWQRWWFLAILIMSLGAIAYLLYRYRVARVVELANVRTRIATDLHDDIGANLTKIAILSEVVKQQHGNGGDGNPLSSIARISRESVAAMGDIVWAINPQRDNLVDLVRRMREHAGEVCLAQDIDLEFHAPETEGRLKLDVDVRRDLYLIFKEAVNNAVRHADCSRLEIGIAEDDGILALTIRDNGKGFDPESAVSGNGLMSMRRRVEVHKGTIEIRSRPGETNIDVRLPYRGSRRLIPTQMGR